MKILMFYFRSRTTGHSIAGLIVVAFLTWLGARLLLARPWAPPEMSLIPVLLFAPLTAACVVGMSARSPFGELERTSGYPLPVLRVVHLTSLMVCACLLLFVVAKGWNVSGVGLSMVRNVLGVSGISFIASWLLGNGLSWTLPLSFVAAVHLTGQDMNGDWSLWAWPAHPATSVWANSIAATLLTSGLFAACFLKPLEIPKRLQ
jgi:membrane-bound metal-dependent hydrolase YbcI (DUF457 family)